MARVPLELGHDFADDETERSLVEKCLSMLSRTKAKGGGLVFGRQYRYVVAFHFHLEKEQHYTRFLQLKNKETLEIEARCLDGSDSRPSFRIVQVL